MTALLRASGVAVPGRLEPIDLSLGGGTMTAIIGPNGSGKTSLLRGLARIDRPAGSAWISEEEIDTLPPSRRSSLVGFLPAARELVWPICVRDVVMMGLERPDPERVEGLLDELELSSLAERPADRLSTGERARALLARVLAPRPAVLLLDEPLSNLDPYWVLATLRVLRATADAGAAVLMSLHDLSLLSAFDRVLMMDSGGLVADGRPCEVLGHATFAATFRVQPHGSGWRLLPD